MNLKKLLVIAVFAALVAAFFVFDLGQYLSLDALKARQAQIDGFYAAQPLLAIALFFAAYVAVTGLSLPGAAIMTLAAGAIFGVFAGTLIVSFASTLGATIAMLVARFLLRDFVQSRYGDSLRAINQGIEKDGAFYLFTLRLVPAFPFFVINLALGMTPMRAWTFAWVSQIGMFLGTVVYVNAGTQLAQLESLRGILSPGLILSFVLLGIFPLLARKAVEFVKARRAPRETATTQSGEA